MKQLKIFPWTLCVMLAFSIFGCKLDSIQDPIIVTNIEKEFYINLWEELYPDTRQLRIDLQSIKNQDCLNYDISYDWENTDKQLSLTINNIETPGDCVPGTGPARAQVTAGPLEGQPYKLTISLAQSVTNQGQLVVNEEAYTLQMESEEGIIIPEKVLRRVPDNTVWGFVAAQDAADLDVAMTILDQLRSFGETANLIEGKYGYFSILDNKLLVSGAPETGQVNSFIIHYEGDEKAIKQLVDDFRASHTGSVSLQVKTAQGSTF